MKKLLIIALIAVALGLSYFFIWKEPGELLPEWKYMTCGGHENYMECNFWFPSYTPDQAASNPSHTFTIPITTIRQYFTDEAFWQANHSAVMCGETRPLPIGNAYNGVQNNGNVEVYVNIWMDFRQANACSTGKYIASMIGEEPPVEPPAETECNAASDCNAWCYAHSCAKVDCTGQWLCENSRCVWQCDEIPPPPDITMLLLVAVLMVIAFVAAALFILTR